MTTRLSTLLVMAGKQSLRQWRSSELYTLFFALLIAVASSSIIAHFSERLQLSMQQQASEFLASDLVISGSLPATSASIGQGLQLGLQTAQTISFSTMLASASDMQLASIKAVAPPYPLRGNLKSKSASTSPEQEGGVPAPGQVWMEQELFTLLQVQPGDMVEIGAASLQASRILTHEPDRGGSFAAFTPRVIMHLDDLPATMAIQPGSRIHHRQLWRGDEQQLQQYLDWLRPQLLPQQKIEQPGEGNPQLDNAMERARQYLSLASLAAILLASVSIALSASNFVVKRYDHAALLRCFGLSRRQTLALFGLQLLFIGIVASLLGVLLGWLGQLLLTHILADLLPGQLPAAAGWQPAITAILAGMVSLLGFALPPLMSLGKVAPLRVLRRDLQPMPTSAWLVYGLALAALAAIMWRLSMDWQLTLIILLGGLGCAMLLGTLLWLALRRLSNILARRNLAWRLGLGNLLGQPVLAVGQILAFALIIFAMALIALLRAELLDNWQQQLPADAANHFAFNIMPGEQHEFARQLAQISPSIAGYYRMTPGRLTHINDEPVLQRLAADSPALRTMQRDLNLTWTSQLPANNEITSGNWWGTQEPQEYIAVSVEDRLAKNLDLKLGDRISFNLGGMQIETRVTNFRSVDWSSMHPNFFVIFAPQQMGSLPHTWITSFYLDSQQQQQLQQLGQQFPAVSLLRIEAVLSQLRSILAQVTLAVEFILLFVLAAGISVLLAGVQATLSGRIHQGALLRALGSKRQLLARINFYEFSTVGLASGLLAWLGCEITSMLLYRMVFNLHWQLHPWLILLPLLGMLLINLAGRIGTRRVINSSPMLILRENS